MTRNTLIAGLIAAALAAAASGCDRVSRRGPLPDQYACEGGRSFQARFEGGRSSVWVTLRTHGFRMARVETEPRVEVAPDGEVIEVPAAPDEDTEVRFTAGANTLTVTGPNATLVLSNGDVYRGCRQTGS